MTTVSVSDRKLKVGQTSTKLLRFHLPKYVDGLVDSLSPSPLALAFRGRINGLELMVT